MDVFVPNLLEYIKRGIERKIQVNFLNLKEIPEFLVVSPGGCGSVNLIRYLENFGKSNLYFERKYKISETNITEIEKNTSFENFKELENKGKFNENSINEITGEKKIFFNLGPDNDWKKILKKENSNKIEKLFANEMKELGYL